MKLPSLNLIKGEGAGAVTSTFCPFEDRSSGLQLMLEGVATAVAR
jgi:hypothetical protein